ncbi:MAG TPA: DNA primase [Methanobacterium sp.]|nr:DNA primase [Methanobacterium sp.]
MIPMSFINPLSDEAKQIVREEKVDLERIFDENDKLINKIYSIKSQDTSDDAFIPKNYADLVIKRIEWYVERKGDPDYNHKKYAFLFHPEITRFDLVAFYILCQAVAVKFGPNSRESRALVDLQGQIVENRLEELSLNKRLKEELTGQVMNELIVQDRIKWTMLSDLLSSKKISLQDLVLKDGYVILDREEFIENFGETIKNRQPEKMYNLLIGKRVKELIIIKMIMQNTENYIKSVYEMSNTVEPNPTILKIADDVAEALSKEIKYYRRSGFGGGEIKASPLNVDLFPPCIKKALEGIKSGGRNEVIVLFLTPFLSYARLNPHVFNSNTTLKVSDVDPDLNITKNEILPMIHDAADRCSPPLFDDQPQEKVNINAKLGFGMHSDLNLQHEGETTWYTPMSCEKVKMNMPALCKPDEVCKRLKEINPLFYYIDQKKK